MKFIDKIKLKIRLSYVILELDLSTFSFFLNENKKWQGKVQGEVFFSN